MVFHQVVWYHKVFLAELDNIIELCEEFNNKIEFCEQHAWYFTNHYNLLGTTMFCKRKLSKDNNCTKNCLVLNQLVAIRGRQNRPIFEPFVKGLLTVPNPLLHLCLLRICLNNSRAFCIHRSTAALGVGMSPSGSICAIHSISLNRWRWSNGETRSSLRTP